VRAVVVERPEQVEYVELDVPEPGPNDVLVASRLAGVCRTDLEIVHGQLDPRFVRYPVVPGHEWSGVVSAVGELVTDLEPGARVVCEGMIPCLRCERCRAGDTNLCLNYDQVGFTRLGGFGEYVVVPRHVVHVLPDAVSFEAATLVEPAACVLRALERATLRPGERVGIVGVGTLGSLAILLAQLYAPEVTVAYGVREEELALAGTLGADISLDVAAVDPVRETELLTGGRLDVVIETAGAVDAVDLSTRLVRSGGRVALLGISGHERTLQLPPDRLSLGDISLVGCLSYTTAVWARTVELVASQRVDLARLVTHRFAAQDASRAFDVLESREGVVTKVVLEHEA
jgi:2-desacetyl-2-hydroxyethyl bacteriochlorophyllide A dehydrogenase